MTESLSPASPPFLVIEFSHPLQYMMSVVVLETVMSTLYTLTPCDPKTFYFNSWLSCTVYDHTSSFPRTTLVISHRDMCGKELKKKLLRFTVVLQHKTLKPPSTQMTKKKNLNGFSDLSEQSVLSHWRNGKEKEMVRKAKKKILNHTKMKGSSYESTKYTVRESNPGLSRGRGVFYH